MGEGGLNFSFKLLIDLSFRPQLGYVLVKKVARKVFVTDDPLHDPLTVLWYVVSPHLSYTVMVATEKWVFPTQRHFHSIRVLSSIFSIKSHILNFFSYEAKGVAR